MTNETDGLLSSLWRASWQGSLVFLFIWLACRILARRVSADAHCWLWRLSYVKLLVGLLWGGAILLPLLSPAPHPLVATTPQAAIVVNQPKVLEQTAANTETSSSAPTTEVKPRLSWQEALAAIYLVGVMVCLGRLLLAAWKTHRILKSMVADATGQETANAASLAQGMKLRHVPALARSMAVSSPVFIAGKIVLPAEADYSTAELTMILAHELAHARRRDLLWEWLGTLVQVMFFFHPFVVLARREERLARESAADALALETTQAQAADYGKMLLSLSLKRVGPHPILFGAVGVIEGGTLLRRRLLALRDAASRNGSRRNRWRIALTLVPLMALIFLPWQVTRGQAQVAVPVPALAAADALKVPTDALKVPIGNKNITGVVLNEKKEPVAGIALSFTWNKTQQLTYGSTQVSMITLPAVITDAQGRFTVTNLPAGDFDYEVGEVGMGPQIQYVKQQSRLVIRENDVQKVLRIVLSTGSLVNGRVVDKNTGKPMASVLVGAGTVPPGGDLSKWVSWTMPSYAETDAQGHYQVRVASGDVFVGVGRVSDNPRVCNTVQTVSVGPGQIASAPDLAVSLHPVIACVKPDGKPAADVTFRMVPDDIAHDGYLSNGSTDETGTVVLNRGNSGSFRLTQGGLAASGTYHSLPDGSVKITMNDQTVNYPSGIATVRLAEGTEGLVTGTVVAEDGKPISGARIRIMESTPPYDGTRFVGSYSLGEYVFKTDASGVFRAPLDPNSKSEYRAFIRADGFNRVGTWGPPLSVAKGNTLNLGTIHLMRADGSISGRVVDSFGKPMSGVLADVRGGKTGASAAVTDDQGHFRIPNVVSGEALRLELFLHGEAPDSGDTNVMSNEEMDIPGVTASPTERQIVWHPHS